MTAVFVVMILFVIFKNIFRVDSFNERLALLVVHHWCINLCVY